jgi:hypothetical protein
MIKWGYIYIKNDINYKPIYPCKLQNKEGKLVEGVIYHVQWKAESWYARPLIEFEELFTLVGIDDVSKF